MCVDPTQESSFYKYYNPAQTPPNMNDEDNSWEEATRSIDRAALKAAYARARLASVNSDKAIRYIRNPLWPVYHRIIKRIQKDGWRKVLYIMPESDAFPRHLLLMLEQIGLGYCLQCEIYSGHRAFLKHYDRASLILKFVTDPFLKHLPARLRSDRETLILIDNHFHKSHPDLAHILLHHRAYETRTIQIGNTDEEEIRQASTPVVPITA